MRRTIAVTCNADDEIYFARRLSGKVFNEFNMFWSMTNYISAA